MNFVGILAGLAAILPAKVLISLGMGVISFAAVTGIINMLIADLQTRFGGLPSDILSLAALGGINTGIGIILGAVVIRVTLNTLPKIGMLPGV